MKCENCNCTYDNCSCYNEGSDCAYEDNSFNESIKGNTSASNPYDDSQWDGK